MNRLSVLRLGTVEYQEASRLQERLAEARREGAIGDTLLVLQHPPVITVGRGGGQEDILATEASLSELGIPVVATDRGGRATYHGPGQLVAYPVLLLADGDCYNYVCRLEEVAIQVLRAYHLSADRLPGHPGVWVNHKKIAALGIAVRENVTRHGLALNVAPRMAHFGLLIPCGVADRGVTSMEQELGWAPDLEQVTDRFIRAFADVFGYQVIEPLAAGRVYPCLPQPFWLWQRLSVERLEGVARMERLLEDLALHTVCQEAGCPNLPECFGEGRATFLILGDVCTRGCRFCAVRRGRPRPPDPAEPERVAEAAARLNLRHVVVTSVTRDDLPDGGAHQFAVTLETVRRRLPEARLEVLIPDFNGSLAALEAVLAARPDVLNHNLETVPRLYPQVRPGADYRRSLGVLAWAKAQAPWVLTKSGLMVGLGERTAEVLQVLYDLRRSCCDMLTLGQYLQPTAQQCPVARYVPPEEFLWYREKAQALGFRGVASGPLVRSSHQAEALWAASTASERHRFAAGRLMHAGTSGLPNLTPASAATR